MLFELAILECVKRNSGKCCSIYLAPTRALCTERHKDWSARFSKIGLSCILATGDTHELSNVTSCNLIVTTLEKLDSMSRIKELTRSMIRKIDVLCIDEIHTVGEERGAVLEAIVSRFKLMAIADKRQGPRIVAVSATIKNVDDIAAWLCDSSGPAQIHDFGNSLRTVPLHRHVFGYPMNGMNAYQFENSLSVRIPWLIKKYSNDLPCLVFCSTRKSAESTANYLARTFEPRSDSNSAVFTEKKLDELVAKGVAFHNAGLLFEDRRTIEFMFTSGKLKVLCATSTLAVGVNLPAHMVIIKGTKQYTNNGYEEYSPIDIQQMMGRAGRPRFDTFGVAVILTTTEIKCLYEQDPQYPLIESR